MHDSGRLIYAASHDSEKVNPCDDFRTFAMGEFLEHRVPNDRYKYIGFERDVHEQHWEKMKRAAASKIKTKEPKMFKVVKSYFQKCADTGRFD